MTSTTAAVSVVEPEGYPMSPQDPLWFYDRRAWIDGVEVLVVPVEEGGDSDDAEERVVAMYHGSLWDGFGQRPLPLEPWRVGSLTGVRAGWTDRTDGLPNHVVFVAADDTWVYIVPVMDEVSAIQGWGNRGPGFDDAVAAMEEHVATMPIPITDPLPRYPSLAPWEFASGDVLVAGDGISVVSETSSGWEETAVISTVPTRRVFSDGTGGLVIQETSIHRAHEPIWWHPSPDEEPVLVADLELTGTTRRDTYSVPHNDLVLISVEQVDGETMVLFRRWNEDTDALYQYSLATEETVLLHETGHPELGYVCVTWSDDQYVASISAEGSIGIVPLESEWDEYGSFYGDLCLDTADDGRIVVAYEEYIQDSDEVAPTLVGYFDESTGTINSDAVTLDDLTGDMFIETVATRGNEAVVAWVENPWEGSTWITQVIHLDTGTIQRLPIGGPASVTP